MFSRRFTYKEACKNAADSFIFGFFLYFEVNKAWPRGYKTFFMLSSVEHEILNAHKCKNIKKFGNF